jgi:hypothetical protein
LPNGRKIYKWPQKVRIAIKYNNIFPFKAIQNVPKSGFFGLQMYHLAVLDAMTAYKTQTWQMVESHRLSMVQAFEFWSISFGSLACIHLLIILPCGGHFFCFEIGKKKHSCICFF